MLNVIGNVHFGAEKGAFIRQIGGFAPKTPAKLLKKGG